MNSRLRSRTQLAHRPSWFGTGTWHSRATLWRYVQHRRRRNQQAAASRRRNRA